MQWWSGEPPTTTGYAEEAAFVLGDGSLTLLEVATGGSSGPYGGPLTGPVRARVRHDPEHERWTVALWPDESD